MNLKIQTSKDAARSDLLALGCFEGERLASPKLQAALAGRKFSAKSGETMLLPSAGLKKAGLVLLVGLGPRGKFTLEHVRRSAAKVLAQAKALKLRSLAIDVLSFTEKFSTEDVSAALVEGLRLSDYYFDKYKSKPSPKTSIDQCALLVESRETSRVRARVAEAELICEAVLFTRGIANEPANVMTPPRLAQAARAMAAKNNLSCRVLGFQEMKRLGMGGILGVSQGSVHPPQFIILENRPPASARAQRPIVLVGKGITFDTGGISIKPANDMDKMKFDMCGAAAVIGAMKAIANLKLPVKVIGLAPVCENMPGSSAQRPGDIITCLNGKTVEVLNTDAEGRLILADALSYAARYKPRALVDIATLTGACSATFSDLASGLMGTDPALVHRIKEAGEAVGERCWELPLWDEYAPLIRATYADIQNISKKMAGTITAGMFLKEFADHTPAWAHLDVAGTAWTDNPKPLSPVGATGVGVRLFAQLVKSYL